MVTPDHPSICAWHAACTQSLDDVSVMMSIRR
jgi:hypothetical protein